MPPRRVAVVVEREAADESESSSDEEQEEEEEVQDEEANDVDALQEEEGEEAEQIAAIPTGHKKLKISLKNETCKVCGKRGHKAGFVGSVYLDCPFKPCYLCKQVGHTTATCPYKIAPGHGCTAAHATSTLNVASTLQARESGFRVRAPPCPKPPRYQVDAAILKLHTRRCVTLEFHPQHDGLVFSGDKKGHIGIWDFNKVHDRTVYTNCHRALLNNIRFLDANTCATSSSDGTVGLLDVETGTPRTLEDLNPNGWHENQPWYMFYGADFSHALHVILAGDSDGFCHVLDPRVPDPINKLSIHKKGSKVNSIHCHPLDPTLMVTAGSDHTVRLFDLRRMTSSPSSTMNGGGPQGALGDDADPTLAPPTPVSAPSTSRGRSKGHAKSPLTSFACAEGGSSSLAIGGSINGGAAASSATAAVGSCQGVGCMSGQIGGTGAAVGKPKGGGGRKQQVCPAELVVLQHPRVVNSASFSAITGARLMSTCQDNRLRVWDTAVRTAGPADREIVHSHDFNRYLTPFKAEWDHKDPTENRIVVGRYISEDFGGRALHPVDILDAGTGALLQECIDMNLTTICPVNKPHPRLDVIVSGSSRSLFLWAPVGDDDGELNLASKECSPVTAAAPSTSKGKGKKTAASGSISAEAQRQMQQRASRKYVFYDADPGSGKKGGGEGGKKRKGGGASNPLDDDDD